MKPTRPEDVFRAEKERAQSDRNSQHARLLAEAKAAFDKLMAEGQAARKSGRPRKHPLPPLKTTSSRTPVKPMPALLVAKVPVPAPPPAAPKAPAAKPSKPAQKASPAVKRASKKAGKPAKSKQKTKPSKKR